MKSFIFETKGEIPGETHVVVKTIDEDGEEKQVGLLSLPYEHWKLLRLILRAGSTSRVLRRGPSVVVKESAVREMEKRG